MPRPSLSRRVDTSPYRVRTTPGPGPGDAPPGEGAAPGDPLSDVCWEGRALAGRYDMETLLGRGGMGAVYRARQRPLGRPVAIKVLTSIAESRPDLVERFEREALAIARLDHPHCIALLDYGVTDEGHRFLVMPLLQGTELRARLGAPLGQRTAVELIGQLLSALEHAHRRGVVHRDLKPENVFVVHGDDGRDVVKLVDFGLAKLLGEHNERPPLTQAGYVFGTPRYMSPEQAAGEAVDEGTDLYAAGVILYELLAGHPPFEACDVVMLLRQQMLAPAPPLPDHVSTELRSVVRRLLEKDRSLRFESAQAAREALERCVLTDGTQAPPPHPAVGAEASHVTREIGCDLHIDLDLGSPDRAEPGWTPDILLDLNPRIRPMHARIGTTPPRVRGTVSPLLIATLFLVAVVSWGIAWMPHPATARMPPDPSDPISRTAAPPAVQPPVDGSERVVEGPLAHRGLQAQTPARDDATQPERTDRGVFDLS